MEELQESPKKRKVFNFKEISEVVRNLAYLFALWAIIITVIFIYTLINAKQQKQQLQEQIIGTTAAAIAPSLIHPEMQSLQEATVSIARAGGFSLVIITDQNGKVLASTDRRFDNQSLNDLTNVSVVPAPYTVNHRTRYDILVASQGITVGFMRIELAKNNN